MSNVSVIDQIMGDKRLYERMRGKSPDYVQLTDPDYKKLCREVKERFPGFEPPVLAILGIKVIRAIRL